MYFAEACKKTPTAFTLYNIIESSRVSPRNPKQGFHLNTVTLQFVLNFSQTLTYLCLTLLQLQGPG
jgi:hypothetical protein